MALLINKPEKISKDHYLLRFNIHGKIPLPGQFINIKINSGTDPLLRRPFSVFNYTDSITEIIVRSVGKGTKELVCAGCGEFDVIGPLGKGFTVLKNRKVLLAGGGVGNAPLYYLAKQLKEQKNHITFVCGFRSEEYVFCRDRYKSLADEFHLVTDNGSAGEKAYVTDKLAHLIGTDDYDMLYTCGPDAMMSKAVALSSKRIPVEVSVENYFGCGIGFCAGCTVDTLHGFKRGCADGPVFDGNELLWENI